MNNHKTILLDGNSLSIDDVIAIAENGCKVDFPEEIKNKIKTDRKRLDTQLIEHPEIKIYGTNVLHGDLKDQQVPLDLIEEYQTKYIKVHNCGTGKDLSIEQVRAIMVIRLNSFAKCKSGMRLETCQLMIDMLNHNITPRVTEEGSVGASGDLIPLAMIGAVMINLPEAVAYYCDEAYYNTPVENRPQLWALTVSEAFSQGHLKPDPDFRLGAKEAMGLTNGSNFIAALSVFAYRDAVRMLKTASLTTALSLEAIRGEQNAFKHLINDNRPHPGQLAIAEHVRNLIKGSGRTTLEAQMTILPGQNPKTAQARVQDRYSFRAAPSVHGAAWEALAKFEDTITIEINSVTDNPLFDFDIADDEYLSAASGANFHGQPLAAVIDYVKPCLTALGLISDKRSFSMLDHALSYGLPADLAYDVTKADGGLMITQYAGAARGAESRILSAPSSVTSLSTSANQEDFVSMGSIGVLHLMKIIYNTQMNLAVELICATRALQLTEDRLPANLAKLGEGTSKVYKLTSENLGSYTGDYYLKSDMDLTHKLVRSGAILETAAEYVVR
ncbi:MAG: aromatic amino acid ammonia-lyase [Candidatus Kapabacteria bacterium]|jgi:histidine ammonia-lyase|nr:aromatic amino acid ammonia-lyase [Candidatus Kapabacteria bacterium]